MTYLSINDLTKRFGVDKTTIWRWRKTQGFPEPIRFSPQCCRWTLPAVEEWEWEAGA